MDAVKLPHAPAETDSTPTRHSVVISCSICDREGEAAVALCTVCNEYLCRSCEVSHRVSKKTKTHMLVLITSRDGISPEVGGDEFIGLNHLPWKCNVHADFFADRYCRSCDEVICLHCAAISEHKRHDWDDTNVILDQHRRRIDGCVEATDVLCKRFENGIAVLEYSLKSLKQSYDSTSERINARYRKIVNDATTRRDELLRTAESVYARENEALSEQRDTLKAVQATLGASLAFARRFLAADSVCLPTETLFLLKPSLTRLDQLQTFYGTYDQRPRASDGLLVVENDPESDLDFGYVIGTLSTVPQPECFSANDIHSAHFIKDKEVSLTFTCRDPRGNIVNTPWNPPPLHVTLQSCQQPEVVVTEASSNVANGQYRVAITPRTYGIHQLAVQALDTDILGSPFSVTVSPSPMAGYAVLVGCVHSEVDGDRARPIGVAVRGEVVVSSHSSGVLVFDRELQSAKRLMADDPRCTVQGIAFDSSGNLLVAEVNLNCVKVVPIGDAFSSSAAASGCIEGHFQYPTSIAIGGEGRIFICDAYRRVSYFTPEHDYLGQFGVEENQRTGEMMIQKDLWCCIAIDNEERVLMSSKQLRKVCIFTKPSSVVSLQSTALNPLGYKLVWSFGDYGPLPERLIGPFGIACDLQYGYIYVTEHSNDSCRLSVFTGDGDYVTSYYGAGEIVFTHLLGVCVCPNTHNVLLADYARKQLMEVCLLDMS